MNKSKLFWLITIILFGGGSFVLLYRQPIYPEPWFDEGLNVSTAMMIAQHQLYALPDSEGPRIMDPAIQTGPPVLLPIALAYRFFPVDIRVARYVIFIFAIPTMLIYLKVAQKLSGNYLGLLALFLLLVGTREPFANFVLMSRQVLGEVPAWGMFLAGLWFWWRSIRHIKTHMLGLVSAGFLWGIAVVTKSQMLIIFTFYWLLLSILGLIFFRNIKFSNYFIPGLVAFIIYGIWYGTQYWIEGPVIFQQNLLLLKQGFAIHVGGFKVIHLKHAAGVIIKSGWFVAGIPALVWGIFRSFRKAQPDMLWLSVVVFQAVALIWFAIFSIGWGRYAFFPFAFTPILAVGAGVEAWRLISQRLTGIWMQILLTGVVLAYSIFNGLITVKEFTISNDQGYSAMVEYLTTHKPINAVVETWEWEIDTVPDIGFHHPSTSVTNAYTGYLYSQENKPDQIYDPISYHPAYILAGPFSTWTGIYDELIKTRTQPVITFGAYTLYKIN